MNKSMLVSISLSFIALITTFESKSTLLNAGDTIAIGGTTTLTSPELVGSVINDNVIQDIISPSGNNLFGVGIEVQNRVVRSHIDDSLIFMPRIIPFLNNTFGNFLIDSVVMSGFSSFMLDVNYLTDGLGDRGPNIGSRSLDGNQLSFDFLFPLVVSNRFQNPQESSYFLSINANTTAYANTGSMQIFGRHLDYAGETFVLNYSGIAVPVLAQVSEPSTLILFLACFCAALTRSRLR